MEEENKLIGKEIIGIMIIVASMALFILTTFLVVDFVKNGTRCEKFLTSISGSKYKDEVPLTEAQKMYLSRYCDWKF